MIKEGKYRYTIQFGTRTAEERQAGYLLEQLGNRKSPIIVAALNEYVINHPDLLEGKASIQFHIVDADQSDLKETIRQMIEERLGNGLPCTSQDAAKKYEEPQQVSDDDILDMLSDLDYFS